VASRFAVPVSLSGRSTGSGTRSAFRQLALVAAGKIKSKEAWINLRDAESGGSSSYLGEIWYAEANAPEGPWLLAQNIVTHHHYSFYNPLHHVFFDQQGGRIIYFEGTYAHAFSATKTPTPRYDYNQVMYRLDLSDARLAPAQQRSPARQ
jgi:hypothetical protein